MNEALVVFSRKGEFKSIVHARDISSREDARKRWPMVTPASPYHLVTWVKPSFAESGKLLRRSHFRVLSDSHHYDFRQHFQIEEAARQVIVQESKEHRQAKELIAAELSRRLRLNLAMPWYFKDETASDYHLEGNLLLGAHDIVTEYPVTTSLDCDYRLDVAILTPTINKEPILLGGVEIELGHAFEGRKALIGKSQGFPLISIDITEMALSDITPEWAENALTATTCSHEKGQRKTYIYLHDLLYPLYAKLPDFIDKEHRHQFLVFAKDDELKNLMKCLNVFSEKFDLAENVMTLSLVNAKSEQSKKMLENAGDVVGADWRKINEQQCLRITIDRPVNPMNKGVYLLHLVMARLLLTHINALVGYKYKNGIINDDMSEDVWIHLKWDAVRKNFDRHRVLPKRLSEPHSRLIEVLDMLEH